MPREMIHTPVGPWYVKVGWNPNGSVQVGVETDDERSLFWMLLGNDPDALTTFGEIAHSIVKAEEAANSEQPVDYVAIATDLLNAMDTETQVGTCTGVWSDLDRRGCNDLIRTIRRARDAAFGKDE